jgi:hypothetical protein
MSWTVAGNSFNSSGDNTIVAAPGAGFRLRIKYLSIQNETSTSTTLLVKWGETTIGRKVLGSASVGYNYHGERGNEWLLPANTALIANLSGANAHNYDIQYRVESV